MSPAPGTTLQFLLHTDGHSGCRQGYARRAAGASGTSAHSSPWQIHMKTMPAAMFRLLTGQETPLYI